MNPLIGISLVDGWLPVVIWVLGLAGMGLLLLRKPHGWVLRVVVLAAGSVLLVFALNWALVYVFGILGETMPNAVLAWAAVGVFGLLLGFQGLRLCARWRRVLTPIAVICVLLLSGLQINAYFGQYVNLGTLLGASDVNLPGLSARDHRAPAPSPANGGAVASGWVAPTGMPDKGQLVQARIPGATSGFQARDAIIYLPPAYATAARPLFPVLVLVAGQPGGPQRWVDAGDIESIMNDFAATHHGLAPVTVIVDATGGTSANTMCMDSKIAQAGTYLSTDVPAWIKANLDVQSDGSRWAFGGFSFGGTCAIQMGTKYPRVYPNVINLSGQLEPELSANRSVTISRSFGADSAAFEANLPMTLLAQQRYPDSAAYFSVGEGDSQYGPGMATLAAAAQAAGMKVDSVTIPGKGHSWSSAKIGLVGGLDFLAQRLGLT